MLWIKRRFLLCALTDISVDFAPNGWQAQRMATPTAVTLALSFTELDIITKDTALSQASNVEVSSASYIHIPRHTYLANISSSSEST